MSDGGEPRSEDREPGRPEAAGTFAIALLSVLFAWWAWQDGAWFGTVFWPGLAILCGGLAILIPRAPWPRSLRRSPAAVALAATALLGLWSVLSALWSPAPDTAVADGQRILAYAICFGAGIWAAALLGRRLELAAVPLAAAGAFAGVATVIALLTGDNPRDYLETEATLDYPLGYRNANAAFFAIALFPAAGLAAARSLDWRARSVALGTATLCASLFLLCQSRASLPAAAIAALVYVVAAPRRLRAVAWLGLAVMAALATLPAAIELHGAGDAPLREAGDELRGAGLAVALVSAGAVVLAALACLGERRLRPAAGDPRRSNRAVAVGLVALLALGAIGFVVRVGDPVEWVDEQVREFRETGTPDLTGEPTRFGFNLGSRRYDLWRVALDEARAAPLTGTGGGGYEYAYNQERKAVGQDARDAHSVAIEVFSELGAPGLVLLLAALGAALVAVLRAHRRDPAAAGLAAIALATGTYWLLHSSVDWFWAYPALTAPVFALLGAAGARSLPPRESTVAHAWPRAGLIAALLVLGVSVIPPFLAERYVNDAFAGWRSDLQRAYRDLDRARALNRLSDAPALAEGAIARTVGDRERALAALREAAEKHPEEWAPHYLIATILIETDRAAARREAAEALRLNPLEERTRDLADRFGIPVPPLPDE